MKCSNCGAEVEGNFCTKCGTPAQNITSQQPVNVGAVQQQNPTVQQVSSQGSQGNAAQKVAYQPPTIVINNTNSNVNTNHNGFADNGISVKSRWLALVLCFFFGALGVHRFYVGKVGTGILWLFTLGLCGFGVLIDFLMILFGSFTDSSHRFLKK